MKIPVHTTVHDVLDYFGACPRCGYPAQARSTVRVFANGDTETETETFCGMPCGWRGPTRRSTGDVYAVTN